MPTINEEKPTVYLTNEQLHRLSGLACDALVGIQLHTDANDNSPVYGEFVHVDRPSGSMEFFYIEADGKLVITT